MYITLSMIAGAVGAVTGLAVTFHRISRWVDRVQYTEHEVAEIKQENRMILEAQFACLDGLTQLGANHTVIATKQKLLEHLNKQAHV